jgi:hypothetical protein
VKKPNKVILRKTDRPLYTFPIVSEFEANQECSYVCEWCTGEFLNKQLKYNFKLFSLIYCKMSNFKYQVSHLQLDPDRQQIFDSGQK